MAIQLNGPFQREALSTYECRHRLSQATWARLLISVRCLPAARPVPLVISGETLLVATDEVAVWEAADRREVLTVNIDGQDGSGATWTVTATGVGQLIDPNSVDFPEDGNHPLLPYISHGARLISLPLTIVAGDQTNWSFPHSAL